jgi:pimeloyl-ACP methyl ester carboxylesterase
VKIIKVSGVIVLLLLILAAGYYVVQDSEVRELDNEIRAELGGTYVDTKHGVIHYQLKGPKNADLVVLVHGFSVPSYLWEPTYQFLLSEGYQVLRFDLFGRGLSDRPDEIYGLDLFSDQINDLLTALDINRPIQLVGLSMGGPVVTRFTNRYPEKVNALILQDPMVNRIDRSLISPLDINGIGEYLFCISVMPRFVTEHKNDPSKGIYFANWGDQYKQQVQFKGFRRAILSSLRYMTEYPFIEEYKALAKIEMPKLLVWGSDDQTIPISESKILRELMPKMEYQVIDGAGHVPSMEAPEKFNPILLQFLKENPWKPDESK